MALVVGVDAAPGGWIAIRLRDHRIVGAASYATFSTLTGAEADAVVIGVDMPIGLPTAAAWPRRADHAARAFLGPRRSSVFVVPTIEALSAATYVEAVAACRNAGIAALSQQAYALRGKLFEVAEQAGDPRVCEIHPEVSFAAMKGGHLQHGKRTWNGHRERRAILREIGLEVPDELGDIGRTGVDDVLDAVAAAWSADRIAASKAHTLPPDPAADEPRIWY